MNALPSLLALLLAAAPVHASGGGHSPPDTWGDGRGASCERGNASFCPQTIAPTGRLPAAPGPLGITGAGAAFLVARRIRARIRP